MDEQKTEFLPKVNLDDMADLYCSVYSGPPWNQEFNREEVFKWLENLPEEGTFMDLSYDQDGKPMSFCIARLSSPQEIVDEYIHTYPSIVLTETEGIENLPKESVEKHVEDLKAVLNENEKIMKSGKLLYLLDVGIRPDLQFGIKGAKATMEMLKSLFLYAKSNSCNLGIAQTLNKGAMMALVSKRTNHEILDFFPKGNETNHVTFLFEPDPNIFKSI